MVKILVILAICCWYTIGLVEATDRPIIGIVAHELVGVNKEKFPDYDSYISASYVKAVESSGARVVPILVAQNDDYYRKIFNSINGLLIPGGATYFNGTNNYYTTGKVLYDLALKANERESFPVLGICLGFELLIHLSNNETEIRKHCSERRINLALQFEPEFNKSSLFRNTPPTVIRTLQTNVTVNFHWWCILPDDFKKAGLDVEWRILSTSTGRTRLPFISSVEHKQYPFVGLQFHPTKHSFEWGLKSNYPHTPESIEAGRHFTDWLVAQARLNNHSFVNNHEESQSLIYNYSPVYSAQYGLSYTQMYLFRDTIQATNETNNVGAN